MDQERRQQLSPEAQALLEKANRPMSRREFLRLSVLAAVLGIFPAFLTACSGGGQPEINEDKGFSFREISDGTIVNFERIEGLAENGEVLNYQDVEIHYSQTLRDKIAANESHYLFLRSEPDTNGARHTQVKLFNNDPGQLPLTIRRVGEVTRPEVVKVIPQDRYGVDVKIFDSDSPQMQKLTSWPYETDNISKKPILTPKFAIYIAGVAQSAEGASGITNLPKERNANYSKIDYQRFGHNLEFFGEGMAVGNLDQQEGKLVFTVEGFIPDHHAVKPINSQP